MAKKLTRKQRRARNRAAWRKKRASLIKKRRPSRGKRRTSRRSTRRVSRRAYKGRRVVRRKTTTRRRRARRAGRPAFLFAGRRKKAPSMAALLRMNKALGINPRRRSRRRRR